MEKVEFQKCLVHSKTRWNKCSKSQGYYFMSLWYIYHIPLSIKRQCSRKRTRNISDKYICNTFLSSLLKMRWSFCIARRLNSFLLLWNLHCFAVTFKFCTRLSSRWTIKKRILCPRWLYHFLAMKTFLLHITYFVSWFMDEKICPLILIYECIIVSRN